MNALMTIRVRVLNQGSGPLAALRSQVQAVQRTVQSSNASVAGAFGGGKRGLAGGIAGLEKMGKSLQWTGRQLEFNFTLPLVAAGYASAKWANQFEAAMTRVRKVYGDGSKSAAEYKQWTDLLGKSFTALSNIFGVNRAEVAQIGAAWAAAGREGVGLAKSVRQTLEMMILGEMEWEDTVKALIGIQQAYHLTVEELHETLTILNQVENQTAVTTKDLIDVMVRAGGAAASYGVTVRELAALTAVLVPTTGSAAAAGNSLKTIFSRLLAPTKQAVDTLREAGIEVESTGWQSLTATGRLEKLAVAWEKLTKGQRAVVAAHVGSRYQINRLDAIMEEIIKTNGVYARAMSATADQTKNQATYEKELRTVLQSSPQAWKIMTTQLQNAMAKAILPMIPALQSLLSYIVKLANAFADLSPQTQQWIMLGLLALAAIGPIARYIGSIGLLLSTLGKAFLLVGKGAGFLLVWVAKLGGLVRFVFSGILIFIEKIIGGVIFGVIRGVSALIAIVTGAASLPAVLLVAGIVAATGVIVAIMTGHGNWLKRLWKSIGDFMHRVWMALPMSVRSALSAVISIISTAIGKIRDLLSYLNPFAKHSPSLVENVDKGTTEISKQYDTARPGIERAKGSVQQLSSAQRGLQAAPAAAAPVPAADASTAAYQQVVQALQSVERQVAQNTAAVSRWNGVMVSSQKAIDAWTAATAHAVEALREIERAEEIKDILAFAPGAAGAAAALWAEEKKLLVAVDELSITISAQGLVIAEWERHLKAADLALEAANNELDRLEAKASASGDALSAAEEHLSNLAQTPIAGMRAMADAIFANEMAVKRIELALINADRVGQGLNESIYQNSIAQKKLQLEIMRTEDQVGMSADQAASKLSALQGEIEGLQATVTDLRLAGAGSDVLGPFNAQIDALRAQQGSIRGSTANLIAMQDQMDALSRAGQMMDLQRELNLAPLNRELELLQQKASELDLQNSLKFDPLIRQIDQMVNGLKEMPFGQLVAEITAAQRAVTTLTAAHNADTAAVARQQAVVDQLVAHRDRVAASLDVEKDKLDALNVSYQAMNDQLQAVQKSYSDLASAAQSAKSAKDKADESNLGAAGMGDFDEAGGTAGLVGAEAGTLPELESLVAAWEAEVDRMFGNLDFFKPVREKWDQFKGWWKNTVVDGVISLFKETPLEPSGKGSSEWIWKDGDWVQVMNPAGLQGVFDTIKNVLGGIGNWFSEMWDKIEPFRKTMGTLLSGIDLGPMLEFFKVVGEAVMELVDAVVNELANWGPALQQVWDFTKRVLEGLVIIIEGAMVVIVAIWRVVWPMLLHTVKPVLDAIISIIVAALQIVRGIFQAVFALLNGDWQGFSDGVKAILNGLWDGIYAIIKGFIGIIIGLVRGFIEGIISFFTWLWDALVGHSIIPDMINAIIAAFNFLLAPIRLVWDTIWLIIQTAWNLVKAVFDIWLAFMKGAFTIAFTILQTVIQTVWNGITSIISFAWGIIKTVLDAIIAFIGGVFRAAWDVLGAFLERVWRGFQKIVQGAWDVVKPILEAIIGFLKGAFTKAFETVGGVIGAVWEGIKTATVTVWNTIKSIISGAVNVAIKVINAFIRGINAVANAIPGVNINIRQIGEVSTADLTIGDSGQTASQIGYVGRASGGILTNEFGWVPTRGIGGGFVTKDPTAIVGEGSSTHPEYIIPTDPAHRDRAMKLTNALLSRLGGGTLPGYGIGFGDLNPIKVGKGLIDKAGGVISDVSGWVRQYGAKAVMAPFMAIADKLLDTLPDFWLKDMAVGLKNKIYNWVTAVDSEGTAGINAANADQAAKNAAASASGQTGGGGEHRAGTWQMITALLKSAGIPFQVSSTTGGRHAAGSLHYAGKAVDLTDPAGPRPHGSAAMLRIFDFLARGQGLNEVFYDPPGWFVDQGRAVQGRIGGHSNHVHAATFARGGVWYPMAAGGIAYTPTQAIVGEAGPEVVAPLDVLMVPLTEGLHSIVVAVQQESLQSALRHARWESLFTATSAGMKSSLDAAAAAVPGLATPIVEAINAAKEAIVSAVGAINITVNAPSSDGGGSAPGPSLPSGTVGAALGSGSHILPGIVGGLLGIRIPGMAEGGIVNTATQAIVGEAGPEAVAPLSVLVNPITEGMIGVVNAVQGFDQHEAMRAARWETMWSAGNAALMEKIGGIKAAVDQVGTTIENTPSSSPPAVGTGPVGGGGGMGVPTAAMGWPAGSPAPGTNIPSGWVLSPATSYDWLPNAPIVAAPGGGTFDPRFPVSIMARGGVARATSGGSIVRVAEAGRDEAIVPLPHGWDSDSLGKKEYNFHGVEFVFPNVTDGDDAEAFLRNLENLVD